MFGRRKWEGSDRQLLPAFLSHYEQAMPAIRELAFKGPEDTPSLLTFLQVKDRLQPILQASRMTPGPKGGGFRKAKKEFEMALHYCVLAGEWAEKLARDPSRARFGAMIGMATAGSSLASSLPPLVDVLRHNAAGDRFDFFVARQLAALLPYRRKMVLFGPQVCEYAAVLPQGKSAFLLAGALSLANREAGEQALASLSSYSDWERSLAPMMDLVRDLAERVPAREATYESVFPEEQQMTLARGGDLLTPVECLAILEMRTRDGLLWGHTCPEITLSMLRGWINRAGDSRDLGVGGLRVQEAPLMGSVDQAYSAALSVFQAWTEA